MPALKIPRIEQIEYWIEGSLVKLLFGNNKLRSGPIVNNTAADIGEQRLNPLSDLRTEVEDASS